MLAASFKRTKIVTTIGPSSRSPQLLEAMMLAGVNAFRLNFSHGTHEEHGAVIQVARGLSDKHQRPIAVIADLQGPKIRVGKLPEDGVPFVVGHTMRFEFEADYDATGVVPVQHDVSRYLKVGEHIFLRDGQIKVEVVKLEHKLISTKVLSAGVLYSNQGMNLPETDLGGEIMTPKDIADLEFAAANDADYVAISFVQTAEDIERIRMRLKKLGSDMLIITKVETRAAIENLEAIVAATDVVMVARGDLAVETQAEAVPTIQRRMIELAKQHRRPVIVATQMLESMISSPQPTRAEVSDVATAVIEGADAVMTSGETAMGLFPVETVEMMKRVILYTERDQINHLPNHLHNFDLPPESSAISAAAVVLAYQLPAKVILAETSSGQTARNIASLRPPVPVIMATDHKRVYQQLALVWGGKSFLLARPEGAATAVIRLLKAAGNVEAGDHIVVASGHQPGLSGGTDTVEVKVVG